MNHNRDYIETTYPELKTSYIECDDGWMPHINKITDILVKEVTRYNALKGTNIVFVINQIKEKYGGLRYYIAFNNTSGADNDFITRLHKYVWDMEYVSTHICEKCGMYGETRKLGGWYKTVCDTCYDELCPKDEEEDKPIDTGVDNG